MSKVLLILVMAAVCSIGNSTVAEDFSIKLTQVADLDTSRPVPRFKVESRLDLDKSRLVDAKMPVKIFEVSLHLTGFRPVKLGAHRVAGPAGRDSVFRSYIYGWYMVLEACLRPQRRFK